MSDVGQNNASDDPLDAVSTAAKVWRKAVAAWAERDDLDHAIMRAFESGRTGEEIAAAGGLDIADVYRVHKRIDQIKADDNLDARLAETGRRTAQLAKRLKADSTNPTTATERETQAGTRSTPDPLSLRWRVDLKVGRRIYAIVGSESSDADLLIGMMDTAELAQEACAAHNGL